MSKEAINKLSDTIRLAQEEFNRDHEGVNVLVGFPKGISPGGITADAVTVDCPVSGDRIVFILQDDQPGKVAYQFGNKLEDSEVNPTIIPFEQATFKKIYDLMKELALS